MMVVGQLYNLLGKLYQFFSNIHLWYSYEFNQVRNRKMWRRTNESSNHRKKMKEIHEYEFYGCDNLENQEQFKLLESLHWICD